MAVARTASRRFLFAFVAIVLGLIVALVVAEVGLRIWDPLHLPLEDMRGFYRTDAQGRIETTPGWTGAQIVEDKPVPIHMNALGLRGPEIGPKAPGELRVLVLGDSFMWGQGVHDDETVPARIEQALRTQGRQVTVGNAGMFGTGPREWSYTLERHRAAFQPDLAVAVMYVGNDVLDSLMDPLDVYDGWLMISGTAKLKDSWRFRMMMTSRVWNHAERLFTKNKIDTMVAESLLRYTPQAKLRVDDAVFLDRDPARDADEPFLGKVEGVLGGYFHAFASAATGLPTLVVLLPGHEVVLKDYQQLLQDYHLDPALHQRGRGHARLMRLLEKEGLQVFDLAPAMLAVAERKPMFLPIDWHFSVRGCEQVARWLLPEIEKRLGRR